MAVSPELVNHFPEEEGKVEAFSPPPCLKHLQSGKLFQNQVLIRLLLSRPHRDLSVEEVEGQVFLHPLLR